MNFSARMLVNYIKEGRGQGHGTEYKPWLQISRRKIPSGGNINLRNLPILGRYGHFLSRNEVNLAIWLLWLGASDLREQFPLWPFSHPHPIYGHPAVAGRQLPRSRGTLAIARDLGIDHGWFPGGCIPYIATTDFMLTVLTDEGPLLVAIAAKPCAIVEKQIAAKQRVKERLALELAYAMELGIHWHPMSDGSLPLPLRENLELALPCALLPEKLDQSCLIDDFYTGLIDDLNAGEPLGVARMRSTQRCRIDIPSGLALFLHGLWTRRLPIDLRAPLVLSQPAQLTDFTWADEAAETIFRGHRHG